ncbi:MAG: DUF512 domain-containing protein [Clostridiales bacterium]|nr:DUF512 domain-containing protein [Clostridiales bacterium]
MSVRIFAVTEGSPAWKAGIRAGERIVSINGEPVTDEIDYQSLSAAEKLKILVSGENGQDPRSLAVRKNEWEPLGLCLDETEAMKPRHCRNRCLFCFVDQLPRGMRDTLYVKDDDWRLSLMMGNYVTLTNVSDEEFGRILARRASPLFISVHATDPQIRCEMLRNRNAGTLMERLTRLKEHGLEFHSQVVLCPGVNDGDVLARTIEDLSSLYPASRSLAIVPVGLTKHREGLAALKGFDALSAAALISFVKGYQQRFLREFGTRFVFPSDEFYCICGEPLPQDSEYEDYPQIENGVGMLRLLEQECEEAWEFLFQDGIPADPGERTVLIPTGVSAQPFIEKIVNHYRPDSTHIRVIPVINRFFGETITVTGLIVGQDLIDTLKGIPCDSIMLCDTMLRDQTDRFLDDTTVEEVRQTLGRPVRIVRNNGESLIRALWEMEDTDG